VKAKGESTPAMGTPKREEIPWPALNNLTPSNLKRTASAIMKEWEKSITPPPENRNDPMSASQQNSQNDEDVRMLLSNLP
jgi:hypothetical protein